MMMLCNADGRFSSDDDDVFSNDNDDDIAHNDDDDSQLRPRRVKQLLCLLATGAQAEAQLMRSC